LKSSSGRVRRRREKRSTVSCCSPKQGARLILNQLLSFRRRRPHTRQSQHRTLPTAHQSTFPFASQVRYHPSLDIPNHLIYLLSYLCSTLRRSLSWYDRLLDLLHSETHPQAFLDRDRRQLHIDAVGDHAGQRVAAGAELVAGRGRMWKRRRRKRDVFGRWTACSEG
jgi:hypothetical protein